MTTKTLKPKSLTDKVAKYLYDHYDADKYMASTDRINKQMAKAFKIPVKQVERIVARKDFNPLKFVNIK